MKTKKLLALLLCSGIVLSGCSAKIQGTDKIASIDGKDYITDDLCEQLTATPTGKLALFSYVLECTLGVGFFENYNLFLFDTSNNDSNMMFIGTMFISFIMIIVVIAKTLMFGDPVGGWPSLVCIIFFVSGVQLFCLGIIGAYLSKTYLETKNRPIYIVKETEKDVK